MAINLKYVVYTETNITLKQPFQLKAVPVSKVCSHYP